MKQAYLSSRRFVYNVLENDDHKNGLSYLVSIFLVTLIIVNVAAFIAESESAIQQQYFDYFERFEYFSVMIFSAEYLLRLWCIPEKTGGTFLEAAKARLNWIRSPLAIIDLIAILPLLLQHFFAIDLRILRLLRLLRILKLSRYSSALRMLLKVLAKESSSLSAMLFILMVLIVMAASGIYLVESKVQPEHFGSVPRAMWWAVVTLTTVGYGDVTPLTPIGKLFGACITILGIGIAALPAGILASGFANELSQEKKEHEDEFRDYLLQATLPLKHKKIEKIRKKTGTSKESAYRIYNEVLDSQSAHDTEKEHDHYCPHCGKPYDDD